MNCAAIVEQVSAEVIMFLAEKEYSWDEKLRAIRELCEENGVRMGEA